MSSKSHSLGSLDPRFSACIFRSLRVWRCLARVAELVDALDSGLSGRTAVGVRVPPLAPHLPDTRPVLGRVFVVLPIGVRRNLEGLSFRARRRSSARLSSVNRRIPSSMVTFGS